LYSDVRGPFEVYLLRGNKYDISFVDDLVEWCGIYLIKTKGESLKFLEFQSELRSKVTNPSKCWGQMEEGSIPQTSLSIFV